VANAEDGVVGLAGVGDNLSDLAERRDTTGDVDSVVVTEVLNITFHAQNVSSEAKLQGVTDIGWDQELGEGSVEEYVLQPGADLLDGFVRHTSVCKLGLSG
jgi:hypothetical protein